MKAQFKYTFLSGLHARGGVFVVIFIMNFIFIVLGSLGLLPFAAKVTAVALGGVAIAVMMACNIVDDISIVRRMFAAPTAYLYALTPAPRQETLLANIIAMLVMDIVTMAVVICGEVWLSFILAGEGIGRVMGEAIQLLSAPELLLGILYIALMLAGYLLFLMIILFGVAIKRSVFYHKQAGGLLTVVSVLGVIYIISLMPIILAPFGTVSRFIVFFTITLSGVGTAMYLLLTLMQTAALFVLTSRLMERKINI